MMEIQVVPQVSLSMSELKKEVNTAAFAAMTAACSVIGNKDIEHMTPKIVRSISNPEEVPEIMHSLAGVTFVQSVQVSERFRKKVADCNMFFHTSLQHLLWWCLC